LVVVAGGTVVAEVEGVKAGVITGAVVVPVEEGEGELELQAVKIRMMVRITREKAAFFIQFSLNL